VIDPIEAGGPNSATEAMDPAADPAGLAAARGRGWPGRTRHAFAFGLSGPEPGEVALGGFLLRGGFVLLALPGLVLPSVIALAGLTGVNAFTISGQPTPWLMGMGILAGIVFSVWFAVAGLMGSVVDVWLVRAALGDGRLALRRSQPLPDTVLLLEMLAVRALCFIPLFGALIWATGHVYDSVYGELITPSDLAVPLAVRVIKDAAGVIAVFVLVWLATETVAAIAVRRLILEGTGIWQALTGGVVLIARRPIAVLSSLAVSLFASVLAVGLPLLGTVLAFDWVRVAARNHSPIALTIPLGPLSTTRDFRPLMLLAAAVVLAFVWLIGFAAAGVASAWRSAAFTGEVAAALPQPRRPTEAGPTE
jgi:hypothetical protein